MTKWALLIVGTVVGMYFAGLISDFRGQPYTCPSAITETAAQLDSVKAGSIIPNRGCEKSDGIQAKPWLCVNKSRKSSAPPLADFILAVNTQGGQLFD